MKSALPLAILLAVVALTFSNSFQAGFSFDNKGLLLQDPRIQEASGGNLQQIVQHTYWWPTGETGLYRPITTLSYLMNYAVLGNRDQPEGYHWINLLLHAGNVLLVYFLLVRFLAPTWVPTFAAALWAVHPALTESVTNIVGRADLLAAMAVLGGLLLYIKSTESTGSMRIAWLAGVLVVTALGMFSKESAVAIVGVLVLYELVWRRDRRGNRPWGLLAVLPPLVWMLAQRAWVLGRSAPAEFPFTANPIVDAGFWTGRLTALKVVALSLKLAVFPAQLSCDYSWPQIPLATGTPGDWTAWVVVVAALVGIALLYRRDRGAFFLACFAAVTFAPTSNLLFPIGTIMAERFLYLPLVGVMACLAWGAFSLSRRFAPAILCLIVICFAARTWARNADWQNDLTLFTSAVKASPNSFKTHRLLADALVQSDPTHSNIDRAIAEAEKGLALLDPLPDSRNTPDPYLYAANYHLVKGDAAKALPILQRAAAIDQLQRSAYAARVHGQPTRYFTGSMIHTSLSTVQLRTRNVAEALTEAEDARALDPLNPEAYRQSAYAFAAAREADAAATILFQGSFVTSDATLRTDLLKLYQLGIDPKGCAVVNGALNASCETVHKHLCAASSATIQTMLAFKGQDAANQARTDFAGIYHCGPVAQSVVGPRIFAARWLSAVAKNRETR